MKPKNRSSATSSRMEVEWALTIERHDVSSGAGTHDDLVVFATSVLPDHSSPELTASNVKRHEHLRGAIDLHGRLVRIIDEAETLDVLSANVTSVTGLC